MKKTIYFFFVLSVLLLGSCFYIRVDYPRERGRVPVDEFHKQVSFPPGGTLSLISGNGNVEIRGWESEELEVYAEKQFRFPDRKRFYVFPRKNLVPGIVFDRFENFVKIRSKEISGDFGTAFVDYYIDAPRSINLRDIEVEKGNIIIDGVYGDAFLDLAEGEILVDHFSGSLTVSVALGSVNASLYDLRDEDEIVVDSREGNITLSLEDHVNAYLVIVFPEGELISEFGLEIPLDEKKVEAQLGEGGPRISITAWRGDVRIRKSEKQE